MKRLGLLLLVALLASSGAWAQKGMNSLGVTVPVGFWKGNLWTGAGMRYQYNISNHVRVDASAGYNFLGVSNDGEYYTNIVRPQGDDYDSKSGWQYSDFRATYQVSFNFHFLLGDVTPVRPYIIAGFGIMGFKEKDYAIQQDGQTGQIEYTSWGSDDLRIVNKERAWPVPNLGIGLNARLSYKWSMQIEALLMYLVTTEVDPQWNSGYRIAFSSETPAIKRFFYNANVSFLYNF